jgi:hypothetical protein
VDKKKLKSFRIGWEREYLAKYLLSRISFVAFPGTVSDDAGADCFCTLFYTKQEGRHEYLLPRSSFAIQIKSGKRRFRPSMDYLHSLQLPYFVGIVNDKIGKLDIYSGEYIPAFLKYRPGSIMEVEFVDKLRDDEKRWQDQHDGSFRIAMPFVTALLTKYTKEEFAFASEELNIVSRHTAILIASSLKEEHIYLDRLCERQSLIIAGSGSNKFFRSNFVDRLGEAFVNLHWILHAKGYKFIPNEFTCLEETLNKVSKLGWPIPSYVLSRYQALKDDLTGMPPRLRLALLRKGIVPV